MLIVQRNADRRVAAGGVFGGVALRLADRRGRSAARRSTRERLFVVLILMFFSMLFWAFFEQAGSSVNNFTDRNVDRVIETRAATTDDVGTPIEMRVPVADHRRAAGGAAAADPGAARTANGEAQPLHAHRARRAAREGRTATDARQTVTSGR